MNINDQKEYFNRTYEDWKEVSDEKLSVIDKTIRKLNLSEGTSLEDDDFFYFTCKNNNHLYEGEYT